MKKILLVSFVFLTCYMRMHAQAVYVDSDIGDDNNSGTKESPVFSINKAAEIISSPDNNIYTIKINPGIYILNKHVEVATKKTMVNKRIVIEATVLPDDPEWKPGKMPVIISRSKTGEIISGDHYLKDNFVTAFYINENHITIRGIKFPGYNYPPAFYYPISRFNKTMSDLLVEQCMFIADLQIVSIQVPVIAHGDSVNINHCVFYKTNNSAVYWFDGNNSPKLGNSMTHCIIYGTRNAVYTCSADSNFVFKNNIVSNSNIFWSICPQYNNAEYSMDSCIVVNCDIYQGNGERAISFPLKETNVIKEGNISLRMINNILEPCPIDQLHIIPGTLGYDLGAGLFKNSK